MTKEQQLNLIKKYSTSYYRDSKSLVTDQEYDRIVREYEEKYGPLPVLDAADKNLAKMKHPIPVTSLAKIYLDEKDTQEKLVKAIYGLWPVIFEAKIDGLTIVAYPNEDKKDGSCLFVTRGKNGIEGEILPFFIEKYMKPYVNRTGYPVRGEAYLSQPNFQKITGMQRNKGEEPFQNIRNAASGILRKHEKSPYINYVSFVAYDIIGFQGTEQEKMEKLLRETKFQVLDHKTYKTEKEALENVQVFYDKWREHNPHIPTDGMVIKTNRPDFKTFGETEHHPNWMIAVKESDETYQVTVTGITWQVGRNKVTPVAEFNPIRIDDTTVSRATLHNLKFLQDLKLCPDDVIEICKSGKIIPKVLRVVKRSKNKSFFLPPVKCPSCGDPLYLIGKSDLKCINDFCPTKVAQNIAFIASKTVLDIPGLSLKTAEKIIEKYGTEQQQRIIFNLTLTDCQKLPGFAEKSGETLYNNIQKARKNVPIEKFIQALCFENVGSLVGKALVARFKTLKTIKNALVFPSALRKISDIGPKTIEVLTSGEFRHAIDELEKYLKVKIDIPTIAQGQQTWVITGKFTEPRKTREELTAMITALGHKVAPAITKDTDILLSAGEDRTSKKLQKAREYGIKVVNYEYLANLCNE